MKKKNRVRSYQLSLLLLPFPLLFHIRVKIKTDTYADNVNALSLTHMHSFHIILYRLTIYV